jgi:predicted dehydrogenase
MPITQAFTQPGVAHGAPADRVTSSHRPRLGFLGVGWIGRNRLDAVAQSGAAQITAVADADLALAQRAAAQLDGAVAVSSLDDLLELDVDALVIATPTALHAPQAIQVLQAGRAVFCQKPLGRTGDETARVIAAARAADRLLAVDMSYRFVRAVEKLKELAETGSIGEIYAADLFFHNAYGPDKPWYYDPVLAGGGCVIDLGIHLVDMALWILDFPAVERVSSRLFTRGKPLVRGDAALEDYAVARLDFANGAVANLSCSWRLPAGCDAVIGASFYGTAGGMSLRNVGGSFYDFRAEQYSGTTAAVLIEPPDPWGGRAAVVWARRLAENGAYDPAIEKTAIVARIVDDIYGAGA